MNDGNASHIDISEIQAQISSVMTHNEEASQVLSSFHPMMDQHNAARHQFNNPASAATGLLGQHATSNNQLQMQTQQQPSA